MAKNGAAKGGETEQRDMVSALITAGAKVNAISHGGLTPLHLACMDFHGAGMPDVIEVLIKAGADVNAIAHEVRARVPP